MVFAAPGTRAGNAGTWQRNAGTRPWPRRGTRTIQADAATCRTAASISARLPAARASGAAAARSSASAAAACPTNLDVADVPFQPWAKALYEARLKVGDKDDPHARCLPPGGPRQFQTPNGFEFIEQPERKRITILFGGGPRSWRFIYLDGRALPDRWTIPISFRPTSAIRPASWDGDTLVVESAGYNEKFWFHRGGLPHTERAASDRALLASRLRHAEVRSDGGRSEGVHAAMDTAASPCRGPTRTGTGRPAARSTSICARTTNATIRGCGDAMTRRSFGFGVACALACVASLASWRAVHAQEGHPLVGTWHGSWGTNAAQPTDVTLVLDFDRKAIIGMMNPGPDSIPFDKVTLNPDTWSVRFEATPRRTNAPAKAAPIVIDVTIRDVTSRRRTLVGTWTQGTIKGDFKASRDD